MALSNMSVEISRCTPEMVLRGTRVGLVETVYLSTSGLRIPFIHRRISWFYGQGTVDPVSRYARRQDEFRFISGTVILCFCLSNEDSPFLEVDEATSAARTKRCSQFRDQEADRRGIFVISMFYNIILSKPFADHYGLKTLGPSPSYHSASSAIDTRRIGSSLHREISECRLARLSR